MVQWQVLLRRDGRGTDHPTTMAQPPTNPLGTSRIRVLAMRNSSIMEAYAATISIVLMLVVSSEVSATAGAPTSWVLETQPPGLPRRHVGSWDAAPMFTPSCVNGAFPGTEEDPTRTVCCQAIAMCVEKFTRPPIKSLVSAFDPMTTCAC